jgi:SAM-dependent methyltransferase
MIPMVQDRHLGGYVAGGDPGTWCPALWSYLVRKYDIRSVLDMGCGEGHAANFFRSLGCDVMGVDGCEQAIRDSAIPDAVRLHDFCHGPFQPGRRFDLVWSCEFLEHIDEEYLPNVLATLLLADKLIAVTHAFPGQPGHHHVNCRTSAYWIEVCERVGLDCRLNDSLAARRATLGDYHRLNHFARSGLIAVPFGDPQDRQVPALDVLRTAGARPGFSARAKEAILHGQTKLARTWVKLTGRKARHAA